MGIIKNIIRKILKEELDSDWDWAIEAMERISGEDLEKFIWGNNLTEIPDHIKHVDGHLNLYDTQIKSLGNLQSVGGDLDLRNAPIKSLGNLQSVGGGLFLNNVQIESMGNLESVGGYLNLFNTQIKSLGNLQSVGGYLNLRNAPISKKYSEQEIRNTVQVNGDIYL